ncbi:TPA: phage N-6-adenine-methyltransferase [Escherichia coli]|nr:phage N-6-adenine-methyltransferase [Escherichia coli]
MSNKYCQELVELRNKPAHELKEVGDQWRTPDNIFWGINTLFGPFVLDLFTDGDNAKCAAYYTAEDNALAHDWSERLAELKGAAFGNGSVPNDELFGIIYTVDEGDDWTDPQVLEKANPNIGVSVYREFLLSQQQRAKNNARLANVFKTKHLNIWVSARSAYFNLVSWQSCEDKSLTLEQFEGQPCILAFDLARKLDMNSMARLYTREIDGKTHYYSVAPRFWVPYDTVYSVEKNEDRRTAERFQKWVEMGVLTVTDGAEVDYRYILEEAKAANKISPVSESPIDPFGATGLSHDLADEDLNPVTIVQNFANMSDPMKELEAAIESGRFHHDGNPIMTWCIGNVVGKNMPGNDDLVKPVKEQAENKIDGAVALIMAVGRAMLYEKEDTLSDHIESYGIRSL